jgi:hypothetical protein
MSEPTPPMDAQRVLEARYALTILTFAVAGPVCGTVATMLMPAALQAFPLPKPWSVHFVELLFLFSLGYIAGFPFALLTGAIFATMAIRFGWKRWWHAMLAALTANVLVLVIWIIVHGGIPLQGVTVHANGIIVLLGRVINWDQLGIDARITLQIPKIGFA